VGKLSELVNKGVRLIVADVPEGAGATEPAAAQDRELPPETFANVEPPAPPARSDVPTTVTDFSAVYSEAGIALPGHGYGIDKVGEMLQNKRFATLGREAKATAVLVALEAAGVSIKDVIEDAVKRDKALDAFEATKEQETRELQKQNQGRIADLNRELEALIAKINSEVETLKRGSEEAGAALRELQARKRREEERLHDLVAHFIEGGENPITTSGLASPPPPPQPRSDKA
jgi:hypothetical protein